MFRKLNLFSTAETFKVLITNDIGDDNLKVSNIISKKDQPAFFEFIDLAEKSLKMIGGIDHSFDFVNDNGVIKTCLIIHYPKFTLTMIGRPDKKHDIKDLYVLLIIDHVAIDNKRKYTFGANPFVWRETFTLEEAQTRYVHSHAPHYCANKVVGRFCIGTSSLPDILLRMINTESGNYDELSFEAYFLLLDAMMRTEYTKGHPYLSIEDIGLKGTYYDKPRYPSSIDWISIFTEDKERLQLFYDFYLNNIEIQKDLSIKIKDETKFREGVEDFCKKYYRKLLSFKEGDGYVFYEEALGMVNNYHQVHSDMFIYGGQEHHVHVIMSEQENGKTVDLNGFSLRGDYITNLVRSLENMFNKELLEYNGINNK